MREWLAVYLKGFLMGTADAVPGVSGGTIALITGIYDRLVDAVAGLTETGPSVLADLVRPAEPGARGHIPERLVAMDLPFLVALGLGVVTGVLTLANVVDFALDAYRAVTFAFFIGLIAASPFVLRGHVDLESPAGAAAGLAGFLVAFGLGWVSGPVLPDGPFVLFLVGAVVICAMVLPGVSGSLILLILGTYERLTTAVGDLTDAVAGLANGGPASAAIDPATTLAVFAAGAFVGLLSFARVVSWALDTYRMATMTFLVGLLVGSLSAPILELLDAVSAWTAGTLAVLVPVALLGAAAVLVLDSMTGGVEY